MGNVRLSYTDTNGNNAIVASEVIEESNYYPFGLQHKGYNNVVSIQNGNTTAQKLKYNGKEYTESFGINMYEYGARNYMPDLGRFFNIDRYAEAYVNLNPYQYTANNPVRFIDVNGDYIFVMNGGSRYRYDNNTGSLKNKDGQDFIPEAGSYLDNILQELNKILGDPDSFGESFLGLFANGNVNVFIKENTYKEKDLINTNFTMGINIFTSFNEKNKVSTTNGNDISPFYVTLTHKLAHVLANSTLNNNKLGETWFEYKLPNGNKKTINKSEVFAVMMENELRESRGLPQRSHYLYSGKLDRSEFQKSMILEKVKSLDGTIKYEPTTGIKIIYNDLINSNE